MKTLKDITQDIFMFSYFMIEEISFALKVKLQISQNRNSMLVEKKLLDGTQ